MSEQPPTAPPRAPFGPVDLAREGLANVATGRWLVVVVVVLSAVVGFVVTGSSVRTADRAGAEADALVVRGRHLVRYTPVVGDVSMAFCDQMAGLDGVLAAGGIGLRERVVLGNEARVPRQDVTAGMVHLLGVRRPPPVGTVLVGSLAAERNGLRDGTWIAFARGAEEPQVSKVVVVPSTARSSRLDDSILTVTPPTGRADECWAEVDPTKKLALVTALTGLDPDDTSSAVAVDFNPALAELDPERNLREVPTSPIVPIGGLAAGLLIGMWWYSRRQEWILYRVFGLGALRRTVIATVEWILVTALPLALGASWAVLLTSPSDRRANVLGWAAAGVAAAWSLAVVGLWGAISSRPRPSTVLKGG